MRNGCRDSQNIGQTRTRTMTKQEEVSLEYLILCHDNFFFFCQHMDLKFFTDKKPHLRRIAKAFQRVTDGEIKKLAISLPPRAGKSYITSLWCAWMIGRNQRDSIMRNSYAADLANTFSYDVRELVQKDKFLEVFPRVKLKADRKSVEDWALETSKRSAYFCAGVGGPITGKGCDKAGILDDPIKNIEDALSETIQDKTWKWYTSTHLSRFETGCPEIHIATRWSKKDIIGRLTDPDSPEYDPEFMTIVIPALDEHGNSFCEEVKTTAEYHAIKRVTDDFIWEAEYMQNPVEEKGLLFPIAELNKFTMDELNDCHPDAIIGFTDPADQGTDFLCSMITRRIGDYTYVTDVIFTQDGVEITEPAVARMMIDKRCKWMNVESNAGGKSFATNVQKLIIEISTECKKSYHSHVKQKGYELDGYYTYHKPTTQNKETRILMNSGYIKQYFYFRSDYEPGSDYDKFMRQLTSYIRLGKNKHDDAPDCTTAAAEYMQNTFYLKPNKLKCKPGWYDETELEDKGYSKGEIDRLKKTNMKGGQIYVDGR